MISATYLPPNSLKKPLSDSTRDFAMIGFPFSTFYFFKSKYKKRPSGESESLLLKPCAIAYEIGKNGLYLLERHHQLLKRIALLVFM